MKRLGVGVDFFDEDFFGGGADELFLDFAAFEKEEGGDVVDAVLLGELRFFLDVDFDDFDFAGKFTGDFVEEGGDHFAGAAPFGPEIDDDEFVGLEDFGLEIGAGDGRNVCAHGD